MQKRGRGSVSCMGASLGEGAQSTAHKVRRVGTIDAEVIVVQLALGNANQVMTQKRSERSNL